MKMVFVASVVVLAIFSYNNGYAQSQVSGRVLIESVPAVKATVLLGKESRITDSTGRFSFSLVNKGRHLLQVSMIGAEPFHKYVIVDGKDTLAPEIQLVPAISTLDAVVLTGTMKPIKRLESPIAVEVYTPQFFKKNPSPSIFESLQNVNGVRPQINCSVCNTGDIHINGLEGPYTMVTIDGMPIVSSLSSVYGLFGIPSELLERVEIIKGPASGLYGSEAIGGLINIITKSPQKAPLFSASLMSTSQLEHNLDLGIKWKLSKLQSLLGINLFSFQKPFDKNNDLFTDVTLQRRVSVFNKWSLQRNFDRVASLAARFFNEDRWGGDMRWTKQFRGSDVIYGESIYTKRWELIGNYQLPLQEKMFASFSATSHDQNSFYGITPYMAKQKILFGQLLWDKTLFNNHELLFGLTGRYNYYDDNSTATKDTLTGLNNPERFFIPGIFIQDELKLSPKHTFLFGLRLDHHPVHKDIFTPRAAYKWTIDEHRAFRLNAGTGFRVVNIFTEDHAALTGARAVEIKEKLKPEESYNVNVNYTHHIGSRARSLNIDAALWYSHFRNQIIANYDTDPNKIIYQNLNGRAASKGFTLNLEGNFSQRLKTIIGFTAQDVAKIETVAGKKKKETPFLTEKWSSTWSVSYTLPLQGLTFDYTGNVYGPMKLPLISSLDPRKPNSPVWSIQNIQVTKNISGNFEFFGGVKNLLNWTPSKNNPFIIARSHDPFDKKVEYESDGSVKQTNENPYALTFDPSYIYAPNQGLRLFAGFRVRVK